MKTRVLSSLALTIVANSTLLAAPLEKWVYCQTNLQVPEQVAFVEQLMRRAHAAGYDHLLLADSKFSRLGQVPERYFEHVKRLRAVAASLPMEIVPTVCPIGYSNDLLYADPNLAEGLPVKDAPFVVANGAARAVTEAPTKLLNGDFANAPRDAGWKVLDGCVAIEHGAVHIANPAGSNARITQTLKLRPFRQYHLTLRVKTKEFAGEVEAKLLTGGRQLNYANLRVKKTQDWTEHHVVFNSLEFTEATLYFGAWGAKSGEAWADDFTLEEAGLVNLLRRPGCPFSITTADGAALVEGRDYEAVRDPDMGAHPYAGSYDVWHAPPAIKTKLPDGTPLRVSFYHTATVYDGQVCACPSEPALADLLRDQARRMTAAWQPVGFMMSHDEWRVMNWCAACQQRYLDAGAMVAANVHDCIELLHAAAPNARLYVWNDMFDPHHNARNNYYLVRGDLTGSWEGLSKDVVIMNWNLRKLGDSLPFFAKRGHQQIIAGYYDANVERLRDHLAAAHGVEGVIGVMYTTWKKNYTDLEAFARIADELGGAK